jgi:hypothetical protein
LTLVLLVGVGIEEHGRRENVDGRPRAMDGLGRPKWMKENVKHEDEGNEFGEGSKMLAFMNVLMWYL